MLTVGFFTPSYEAEAELLRASLERVGMPHEITAYPDRGSWDRNTAHKPVLIREARETHEGALLYVDVDAFVHSDCRRNFRRLEKRGTDFAAHWFAGPRAGHSRRDVCECVKGGPCSREHRLLSGTMFFGDTPGARRLLDLWVGWNEAAAARGVASGGGQRNLWALLSAHGDEFRTERLPGRYTYVFDKPWAYPEDEPCIIEHTIASREHRGKTVTGRRARERRKAELRRILETVPA